MILYLLGILTGYVIMIAVAYPVGYFGERIRHRREIRRSP